MRYVKLYNLNHLKSVDIKDNVYNTYFVNYINEVGMKINKAVIYYYELIGITEYKLATVSGIDRGALHRMLKHDDWEPNIYTLKKIARAVSVNVSDLIIKAESFK